MRDITALIKEISNNVVEKEIGYLDHVIRAFKTLIKKMTNQDVDTDTLESSLVSTGKYGCNGTFKKNGFEMVLLNLSRSIDDNKKSDFLDELKSLKEMIDTFS